MANKNAVSLSSAFVSVGSEWLWGSEALLVANVVINFSIPRRRRPELQWATGLQWAIVSYSELLRAGDQFG